MADDITRAGAGFRDRRGVRSARAGAGAWWLADVVRWLALSLVCAGGSLGLSWLGPVVPLPSLVRGVGGLFAIFILPLATVLVPVFVLRRVPRKKRKAAWQSLRTAHRRRTGHLALAFGGDGCLDSTTKGDELRVRYDPAGVAGPDDGRTGSNGVLLATLFAAAVVMGMWGGVRQSRWDRAYGGA
ncbi:hypothetical protein [Streptomyces sp. NPDC048187]|uniref:hypothetical protein n=1 Tax=Streptomyces sp. NPDC048187 TaxID=3365509 RepID=UPI003721417C